MSGNLRFEDLKTKVADGSIDTVLACLVDMQGRLMGKRFHAANFVEHGWRETHCCNYLLTVDMEMTTVQGYASSSWQTGYGDYVLKPDLATLRRIPWLEGTALVLGDTLDHHGNEVPHSPRAILKKQVARADAMGFDAMMATELEFYLFENSYADLRDQGVVVIVVALVVVIDFVIVVAGGTTTTNVIGEVVSSSSWREGEEGKRTLGLDLKHDKKFAVDLS